MKVDYKVEAGWPCTAYFGDNYFKAKEYYDNLTGGGYRASLIRTTSELIESNGLTKDPLDCKGIEVTEI